MRIVLVTIWIMITLQLTESLPALTNLVNVQQESENNEMTEEGAAIKSNYDNINKMSSRDYGPDSDRSWDYDSDEDFDYSNSDNSDRNSHGDGYENSRRGYRRSKSSRNATKSSGNCNEETMKHSLTKVSPKDKASNIAMKAAQDAKAASDAQCQAAKEAAHHVKAELAEKALQAAKAAEAALAGKQQILEQLEHENTEAEAVIKDEQVAQRTSQANQEATQQAAHCANEQFKALSAVLDNAKDNHENLERVRNGAEQELEQKRQLLGAAKNRLVMLQKQLKVAEEDLEKTKCAAYRAACAAVEAQQKACQS